MWHILRKPYLTASECFRMDTVERDLDIFMDLFKLKDVHVNRKYIRELMARSEGIIEIGRLLRMENTRRDKPTDGFMDEWNKVESPKVEPFDCCICLEKKTKESKKCKNKHPDKICESCIKKMDKCPFCREVIR
jgi:hypothetical protein